MLGYRGTGAVSDIDVELLSRRTGGDTGYVLHMGSGMMLMDRFRTSLLLSYPLIPPVHLSSVAFRLFPSSSLLVHHSPYLQSPVYDVSSRQTFDELLKWFKEIDTYCGEGVVKIVVGNKVDKVRSTLSRRPWG